MLLFTSRNAKFRRSEGAAMAAGRGPLQESNSSGRESVLPKFV